MALTILTIVSVKSSDFLPSGWTAHSSQGKTYYYNQRTGTSQWEKPLSTQAVNFHQNSQTQHGQMAAASSSNIWIDRTGYQQQQNTGKTPHLNPSVQQSIYVEQRMNDSTISLDNERADAAWTTQRSQSATANRQPQSYKPSNGVASATDHSTASSVLTEYQLVSESAGNISVPHISSSPEHPAFVIRDDVYFNGSSVEQTISSIDASSNSQRLIAEIEEAGKQIVDLNIMIEGLEAEKETLLQIVKSGEDTVNNITQSLQSTSEMQKIIDSKALSEMESRATSLQEELKIRQEELETLKVGKESLEVDLNLIKISNLALTATLVEIKSNLTSQSLELRVSAGRLVEQEKELSEAYKEIGQLEDDMKNIAEPSLRRLRQPSFISRILENAFPVWSKGTNSSGGKRVKGQSPVATAESMRTLNRTVDSLRENLTAIAAAMEGKEALIEELLNQLAERVEEADNR